MPSNEYLALIDLSETWLNPSSEPRNAAVLEELGQGFVAAADAVPTPVVIQYRVIGGQSYEQLPACDAFYQPTMITTGKKRPAWLVTKLKKLEQYLSVDCPSVLLNRPAEPMTEISAALASVAAKPRAPSTRRTIVLVSDFLEETPETTSLEEYDFKGTRALLLYRPLRGELAATTRPRVQAWKAVLEGRGAAVTVWPDTALKRADVTAYLTSRETKDH